MSKRVVELNPEDVLEILKEHEDILTPALREKEKEFQGMRCPDCGSSAIMKVDPEVLFEDNSPLPKYAAFCPICDKRIK